MKFSKKGATAAAVVAVATLFPLQASERLTEALGSVTQASTEEVTTEEPEVATEPETKPMWVGRGFNYHESVTLKVLQERGITDRRALAVILGNIKQESRFHPNICEGGHRVSYHRCYSGGYGLIQWTTASRYHGLGRFAVRTGGNASTLHTQLGYLFTEYQWKVIERTMKTPGLSINTYMNAAYRWLGWGIHGARTTYSYQYYDRLFMGKG